MFILNKLSTKKCSPFINLWNSSKLFLPTSLFLQLAQSSIVFNVLMVVLIDSMVLTDKPFLLIINSFNVLRNLSTSPSILYFKINFLVSCHCNDIPTEDHFQLD